MTALTDTAENNFMKLFFHNLGWTGIADPAASGNITTYYVAFHKSDPTDTGSLAGEPTYTGYSRASIARSSSAWNISGGGTGNTVTPVAVINGGTCTAQGTEPSTLPFNLTHFSINSASTGGTMYIKGSLSPPISVNVGVTPQLSISTNITAD